MTGQKQHRALGAMETFLTTPLDTILARSTEIAPEAAALSLFRDVAERVPAYRSLLAEHDINPASITALEDLRRLPLLTKENYLRRFPLAELCWDGELESCDFIAVSSGSTGQPTFWPRFISDEFNIAARFEQVFRDSFRAHERRTLAVVCFALGTWVGGMYTANCVRHLAAKGYPVVVITPGNNKDEIFRVIGDLGSQFEQVVLCGYPPFLKDVVDTGKARGIAWGRYNLKLVLAGEVFSEEWRTLMTERAEMTDQNFNSTSLYGTADAGVLANETPLSVCIRRWLATHPDAATELFGESRLPTLAQYDPLSRFFEVHDGTLLFSGDNGIPLVRYHIADTGGLIGYDEILAFTHAHGFDPLAELGDTTHSARRLPFVYVFGRSHFTVSYFGANIYPENVTVGLEQTTIKDWVTGKFVLEAREDNDRNRFLAVAVELAPNIEPASEMTDTIAASIRDQLRRLNSEFANYVPDEYQLPRVTLHATGDPEYFAIGTKHLYTRKSQS